VTIEAVVRSESRTAARLLRLRLGLRSLSAPDRLAEVDVVLVGQRAGAGADCTAD
jgi:hypothetical protein